MKRTSPLRRTPIRRVSKKRAKQLREYSAARKVFLAAHPICEVWCANNNWEWIAPSQYSRKGWSGIERIESGAELLAGGAPAAEEVHHTNRRNGDRLNDEKHWLAVSREWHFWIHANPSAAREKGWLPK